MKRIVLAGIVAVLLIAISAGASSNVAYANSSSNGTSTTLTSTWAEYSNVSIAPAATGNTTVSISVVARINYSQAILYGRLKRNGVVFETFNLSQSTYPGSMTFSGSRVEASGTQYYSFEAYCTSGRLCTIMNRTFNVLYTNPDITALTLNQINSSAGIDGLRVNDTVHDTKFNNVNTTTAALQLNDTGINNTIDSRTTEFRGNDTLIRAILNWVNATHLPNSTWNSNFPNSTFQGKIDSANASIASINITKANKSDIGEFTGGTLGLDRIPATLTGKDADTVDGYHLNQGVRTTDSPTFVGMNSTYANISGVNVTQAPCSYGFGGDYSYLICTDGTTVYAKNGSTGKVDYSGTFFRTVINDAYLAGGEGTVIHVGCGTYTQTGTINITSKNDVFEGNGGCTTLNVNNAVIPFNASSVSGIKIRNFNISISNRDGVVFNNVSDSEVTGLNITGSFTPTGSRYAIRLYNSQRNTISGNRISGTGWDGAIRTENTPNGVNEQFNRIVDNTFFDLGGAHASLASGMGIELEAGSGYMRNIGNVVSGNICKNITGHCIRPIATYHSSFTNNVGDGIGKSFFWVDGASVGEEEDLSRFNTFVGNVANNVSQEVFDIIGEDNVFEGNVITNSSSTAYNFSTVSKNNTVRGGMVYNTTGTADTGTGNSIKDVFGLPGFNHGNRANCTTITAFGSLDTCGNTTLGLPMWWNGTFWVKADGTRP